MHSNVKLPRNKITAKFDKIAKSSNTVKNSQLPFKGRSRKKETVNSRGTTSKVSVGGFSAGGGVTDVREEAFRGA